MAVYSERIKCSIFMFLHKKKDLGSLRLEDMGKKCLCVPAKTFFLCLLCDSHWELGHINEAPQGEEEKKNIM